MDASLTLFLALVIDALFGDPEDLYRRIPHPVVLIGRLIGLLDRLLNRNSPTVRRVLGVGVALGVPGLAASVGWLLSDALGRVEGGWVLEAFLASTLLAQNSLHSHVRAVAKALGEGLDAGRVAVARIVGRDPNQLDEPAICRAAIESTAENFSDGVVAPVLAFLVGGLPGLLAYKALNTGDSMIGHLTERHRDFGWATARLDDLVNWIPARLSALLFAVAAVVQAAANPTAALAAARRDAPHHRSVNAGWPEAALAGALNFRLAGPRRYEDVLVQDAWMGDGRADLTPEDIEQALSLYRAACLGLWAIVGVVWVWMNVL
jgi:adenosylcobinamide-phosphate synthase